MDSDEMALSFEQFVANGRQYWDDIASGGQETRWLRMEHLTGTEIDDAGAETSLGWTKSSDRNHANVSDLRRAYNQLNISGLKEANRSVTLAQNKDFNPGGAIRPATGGVNDNEYNVTGKTIVGSRNVSPLHNMRDKLEIKKLSPEQALGLPHVKFWSDIVWIVWASLAKTDAEASSLKYIFRHHVKNEETVFVIENVFGVSRGSFPDGEEWPGQKLVPGEEKFLAVLGTPHGRGIAYLIKDHPNELPEKTIESINVFRGDNDARQWHLLFTLNGPRNNPLGPSDFIPSPADDSDSKSSTDEPGTESPSSLERSGGSTPYAELFKSRLSRSDLPGC